jgi:hypothetical protein
VAPPFPLIPAMSRPTPGTPPIDRETRPHMGWVAATPPPTPGWTFGLVMRSP